MDYNLKSSKSKMSSLFGGSGGDEDEGTGGALKFQAPKDPSRQKAAPKKPPVPPAPQSQQAQPAQQAQQAQPATAIIFNTQLRLFIFDRATNAYKPGGNGGPCGCVIVGGGTTYNLLIYDSTKKHLCQAPITPQFKLSVQANLYVSFSLPSGEAFSANFATEDLLRNFCKNIMLAAAHTARFTQTDLQETLLQVSPPSDGVSVLAEPGDTCGVVYAVWDLATDATTAPNAGVSSAPASDNGGEITKLKAGDVKGEPVQGVAHVLVGMPLKAVRYFIIHSIDPKVPSRFVTIDLQKCKKKTKEVPPEEHRPSEEPEVRESRSSSSVKDRMAKMASAGGGGAMYVPSEGGTVGTVAAAIKDTQDTQPLVEQTMEPVKKEQVVQNEAPTSTQVQQQQQQQQQQASEQPASEAQSLVIVPGETSRSHFAQPAVNTSNNNTSQVAPPPPTPGSNQNNSDGTWAALVLQQQQQAQSTLLNMQGTLMSVGSKVDKMDALLAQQAQEKQMAALTSAAQAPMLAQMQQLQLQQMQMGAMGQIANPMMSAGLQQGYPPQQQQQQYPPQQQQGYPPQQQQAPYVPPQQKSYALASGDDVDLNMVQDLFTKLFDEHSKLRSNLGAGSEETNQLKNKIEELNNKVSKLMTEKMELLEQAHSTLSSGSSNEKRIVSLEVELNQIQNKLNEKDKETNEQQNKLQETSKELSEKLLLIQDLEEQKQKSIEMLQETESRYEKEMISKTETLQLQLEDKDKEIQSAIEKTKQELQLNQLASANEATEQAKLLNESLEEIKAKNFTLESELTETEKTINNYLEEINKYKTQLLECEQKNINYETELKKEKEDNAILQNKIKMKEEVEEEQSNSMSSSNSSGKSQEEIDDIVKKAIEETILKTKDEMITKHKIEIDNLNKEMSTTNEKLVQLEANNKDLTEKNAELAAAPPTAAAVEKPPIKGIMEDIYNMLYTNMKLGDDLTAQFTAKQVNKGVRDTLKQVATKYADE